MHGEPGHRLGRRAVVELLLDTFLVRGTLVPALARLLAPGSDGAGQPPVTMRTRPALSS